MDSIFFTIVRRGKANAILRKARECGAEGGTIFLGEGMVQSNLLTKMGLNATHKELLMIPASEELCDRLHDVISGVFRFSERNKGIAFSIPFKRWQLRDTGPEIKLTEEFNFQYFCIIVIVDKGRSKDCIKVARSAGAKGGTLIHGRGAGIPADFYFPLVIEPQKDIIIIISEKDKTAAIRERISSELDLKKIGNGIIFILPASRTNGLYENRQKERRGVTS